MYTFFLTIKIIISRSYPSCPCICFPLLVGLDSRWDFEKSESEDFLSPCTHYEATLLLVGTMSQRACILCVYFRQMNMIMLSGLCFLFVNKIEAWWFVSYLVLFPLSSLSSHLISLRHRDSLTRIGLGRSWIYHPSVPSYLFLAYLMCAGLCLCFISLYSSILVKFVW